MVTHVYTDSRFCGWLWDDVVVGGGGAIPRCHLARFLVLVLFRLSQSLVPGVLAVRETSYINTVYIIFGGTLFKAERRTFSCVKQFAKFIFATSEIFSSCYIYFTMVTVYILCTEMSIY